MAPCDTKGDIIFLTFLTTPIQNNRYHHHVTLAVYRSIGWQGFKFRSCRSLNLWHQPTRRKLQPNLTANDHVNLSCFSQISCSCSSSQQTKHWLTNQLDHHENFYKCITDSISWSCCIPALCTTKLSCSRARASLSYQTLCLASTINYSRDYHETWPKEGTQETRCFRV